MKKHLSLITDATCDLPLALIEKYDITLLIIPISFQNETRKQYVDITTDEFFEKIKIEKDLPTTGVPSPKAFQDCFKQALEKSDEAIMLCVSSELSGLYEKAVIFSKEFAENKIHVIDSRATTHALGSLVVRTAEMIKNGLKKDVIIETIQKELIPNIRAFIFVDTLSFIRKSGRIDRFQYLVGEFLQLKPLLTLENGSISTVGRVRGKKAIISSLKKLGERVINTLSDNDTLIIGHSRNQGKAQELAEYLRPLVKNNTLIEIWEIGPTLGVHAGPGALSLLWFGEEIDKSSII